MFENQKLSTEDKVWIRELTLLLDRVLKDERYKDQKEIRRIIYGLYQIIDKKHIITKNTNL